MLQLIAERPAGKEAIRLPLALAVAFHDDATGTVSEANTVISLIDLLAAFAGTAHEALPEVFLADAKLAHTLGQLLAFLWRNRHDNTQATRVPPYPLPPALASEPDTPRQAVGLRG